MVPNWLEPFFTFFPAYAWFFLGLGIPWALVLLPRDEWRNRPTVLALGLALGPTIGSVWLFFLGTFGTFLPERALTGTILLAVIGFTGAWLRRHTGYIAAHTRPEPWNAVEKTLLVMMALALVVHIWITMFWPFVQYDTLWTFGYNPKIFFLYQEIPNWIDYYPQQIPLTYTYGYILNNGIDDHVAKAAVPWFMLGSIMMSYILGARVWGKRSIGIYTAALWMLIPSALLWSGSGDLEHPITIYFTGAIVFFVLAWRSHHWRYAMISGILFSGALWTKPTAGAFALGVILLIAVLAIRLWLPRHWQERLAITPANADTRALFWQKFRVAAITGISCLPIGALWYVRNLSLGHAVIDFPADYWNDLAQRSGQEFGWLILIVLLLVGMMSQRLWKAWRMGQQSARQRLLRLWLGLGLFLAGTLPSALVVGRPWTERSLWNWIQGSRPQLERLSAVEVLLIVVGLALMVAQMWQAWKKTSERARSSTLLTGVLIAPFTMVWFWNYSYHFRLMLTITPVLAAMVAALLDAWLIPLWQKNTLRRRAAVLLTVLLSLPALFIASYDTLKYTVEEPLTTDTDKYNAANPELMATVRSLRREIENRPFQEEFYIYTLGENRLNFFFPEFRYIWDDELPTEINDIFLNTSFIIAGSHAEFLWQRTATYPNQLSAMLEMGRYYEDPYIEYNEGNIMGMVFNLMRSYDSSVNRRDLYQVYTPHRNYTIEELSPPILFEAAQWQGIALRGIDVRRPVGEDSEPIVPDADGVITLRAGEPIFLQLYWQRTDPEQPIAKNYSVFIHLRDADTGEILAQRDGELVDGILPMTLMPHPDLIADRRLWFLPPDLPSGAVELFIGIYDPLDPQNQRLPVIGGADIGQDGILVSGRLAVE